MESSPGFSGIDRLERSDDWGVYKTLLESTKAIPWKINWQTKQFDYIGPQIESLLGWPRDSWLGAMDWIERIHPEDREYTTNFCISQSEEGVDHEADYRALKADGSYVWIRDVVHVIRDESGVTTDLVGFMFDISARKQMEQEVVELNRKLEAWSNQDGLTGVANRRLFDQTMGAEWARGRRSGAPLSLLMLDVDHFKLYNDGQGHVSGDSALKAVAGLLKAAARRPYDLAARYGGEEFLLLLPGAEEPEALVGRIVEGLTALQISHPASPVAPYLTVSCGCVVASELADVGPLDLLAECDRALYRAKAEGRNRTHFSRI